MPKRPHRNPNQPDLFDRLLAAKPIARFEPEAVRAATLQGRIAKGIKAALAGKSRTNIAKAMSEFLGESVTDHMLNAYASEAKGDKPIPLTRFMALIHVTGDKRLLNLIAETFGVVVVDASSEPLIRAGEAAARLRDLRAELDLNETELSLALRMSKERR